MKNKWISLGLGVVLLASVLTGCGKSSDTAEENQAYPTGEISYPIESDVTLKYWVRLPGSLGTSVKNFAETEFAKKYSENTGIKVEYQHPAQGQETEVLNLLIASGDLPDIIEANWMERDPEAVIKKKTILALNNYIDQYSPNLKKYLAENPDIDKQIKTDSNNYYVYPFIRGDEKLLATNGFMIRRDWLEELGLESPETMEEWTAVLKEFKAKKCDMPVAMSLVGLYRFASAYDAPNDFFCENGKVIYGPAQESFKDFLEEMKNWYDMGILDVNFTILDSQLIRSNMLNGESGAVFGAGGGLMGTMLNAKADSDEEFDLAAVKYPVLKKGDKPKFGNKSFSYSPVNGAAITAQCKYPELAARFLDYSYSEEGYMLNNFGIEGESYEMIDGYPTYKEVITKNPNGLAMSQALPLYVRAANEGPFVQDVRYIEQYYSHPQQQEALELWSDNDDLDYRIPQVTLTSEESREYSAIMNEIQTYQDEIVTKFIIGEESLDHFDKYIEDLKNMQLDRAIEIKQAALDRFNNR